MYAQADLRLCWSHIPHCWKSPVAAHFVLYSVLNKVLKNLVFMVNLYGLKEDRGSSPVFVNLK